MPIYSYKTVFLGDAGVGKTTLIQKMSPRIIMPLNTYIGGIPIGFNTSKGRLILDCWSKEGKQSNTELLQEANLVVMVLDVSVYTSFESVKYYKGLTKRHAPKAKILFVANKTDLKIEDCQVMPDDVKDLNPILTSAKSGRGSSVLWKTLVQKALGKDTKVI